MDNFLDIKYGLAAFLLLLTLVSGWYPFAKRKTSTHTFPLADAFASGVFIGAGLIHMLPDAAQSFVEAGYDYPFAALIAVSVLLVLLWFEHYGSELYHHHHQGSFVLISVIMLSIHSLLEGGALGLVEHFALLSVLAIAILGHKWAAGFALAVQINKSDLCFRTRLAYYVIFALMTPLGIVGGSLVHHYGESATLIASINAMAAGTFLYLGTLHGLNRAVMIEKCCNMRQYSFVVLGFALMAVIAIWL